MAEPQLSLQMAIDQVSQEKGIEPRVLVEAIEQAILTAAKRHFGADRDLEAEYNPQTGQVDLKMFMTVVEEIDNDQVEIALEDARRNNADRLPGATAYVTLEPCHHQGRTGPDLRDPTT